jgi:hypothetical protein
MMNSALNISVILVVSTICAAFLHWFERPKSVPPVVREPPAPPSPEPIARVSDDWLTLRAKFEKTITKIRQETARFDTGWTDIL